MPPRDSGNSVTAAQRASLPKAHTLPGIPPESSLVQAKKCTECKQWMEHIGGLCFSCHRGEAQLSNTVSAYPMVPRQLLQPHHQARQCRCRRLLQPRPHSGAPHGFPPSNPTEDAMSFISGSESPHHIQAKQAWPGSLHSHKHPIGQASAPSSTAPSKRAAPEGPPSPAPTEAHR